MKKLFTLLVLASIFSLSTTEVQGQENHGGALNTFIKFGDDSNLAAHYEIQIMNNLTVSPEARIWFDGDNSFAIGGRADYYFDSLFGLPEKWDIWGGVDAGIIVDGDDDFDFNLHAGIEYRFTDFIGLIFEFAGGTTSSGGIGVAFHL